MENAPKADGQSGKTIAFISVAASVLSAVVVAWISKSTSLDIAKLEASARTTANEIEDKKLQEQRDARESSVQMEQARVRDQQDTRRLAFLEKHLPQLLSSKETERRVATALLRIIYPSEAAEVLAQISPLAAPATRLAMQQDQKDAEVLRTATGDWAIVISADRTFDLAAKWLTGVQSRGNSPAQLYFRDGLYRVTVGSYPTRQLAEQAAIALRPQTRADAYVVAVGRWCQNRSPRREGAVDVVVCSAEK